jgi:hypothetical protein
MDGYEYDLAHTHTYIHTYIYTLLWHTLTHTYMHTYIYTLQSFSALVDGYEYHLAESLSPE